MKYERREMVANKFVKLTRRRIIEANLGNEVWYEYRGKYGSKYEVWRDTYALSDDDDNECFERYF